jgi:hypothetical protein
MLQLSSHFPLVRQLLEAAGTRAIYGGRTQAIYVLEMMVSGGGLAVSLPSVGRAAERRFRANAEGPCLFSRFGIEAVFDLFRDGRTSAAFSVFLLAAGPILSRPGDLELKLLLVGWIISSTRPVASSPGIVATTLRSVGVLDGGDTVPDGIKQLLFVAGEAEESARTAAVAVDVLRVAVPLLQEHLATRLGAHEAIIGHVSDLFVAEAPRVLKVSLAKFMLAVGNEGGWRGPFLRLLVAQPLSFQALLDVVESSLSDAGNPESDDFSTHYYDKLLTILLGLGDVNHEIVQCTLREHPGVSACVGNQ